MPNLLSYHCVPYLHAWKLRTATFWRFLRLKSKLISKDTYGRDKEHIVNELVHQPRDFPKDIIHVCNSLEQPSVSEISSDFCVIFQ